MFFLYFPVNWPNFISFKGIKSECLFLKTIFCQRIYPNKILTFHLNFYPQRNKGEYEKVSELFSFLQ